MTLRWNSMAEVGFIIAAVLVGCAAPQPPPAPIDTRAADEATIRKADEDWAKAAQTKQVAAWVAFYADDAVVLPPNDTTATSKESISKAVGDLLTLPSLTIDWQPVKIEVARSGDIAYARGTYELAYKNPKGKRITDRGKYLEIWKKRPDGGWKCIVDTWNSDLPS
jgi:ketosteroid isomerase-like protein